MGREKPLIKGELVKRESSAKSSYLTRLVVFKVIIANIIRTKSRYSKTMQMHCEDQATQIDGLFGKTIVQKRHFI